MKPHIFLFAGQWYAGLGERVERFPEFRLACIFAEYLYRTYA